MAHRCYRVSLIIDRRVLAVKGVLVLSPNYRERLARPLPHLTFLEIGISRVRGRYYRFRVLLSTLPNDHRKCPSTCVFSAADGLFARSRD